MHLSSWAILTRILPPPYLPGLKCGALSPCMCPLPPSAPLLSPVIHSVTSQAQYQLLPCAPTKASHFLLRADDHPSMTLVAPLACPESQCTTESSRLEGNCSAYPLASLSGVASQLLSSTSLPDPATETISEDIPVRWDNSPCQLQ